jgi:elongation factor P
MPTTSSFKKDMYIKVDGKIHYIVERQYKTQGRGGGLIILRMRNLENGNLVTKTVKEGTEFEEVFPETRAAQFLYDEGDNYIFMDTKTFENLTVPSAVIGDYNVFLKDGETYLMLINEGKVINVKFPAKIDLKVIEAPEAVKGNTAGAATKVVTVEGGLKVSVPLFVKEGDVISVNTDTHKYSGKSNK